MAKRTWAQLADVIEDRVDKDQADTTFDTFVQSLLSVTLQEIITEVPWARWLFEEHSITLTASQQYVTMPSSMDLEGPVTLRDDTNNRRVLRITAEEADRIDPGRDLGGNVVLWWSQRVGGADRIYFIPQPDAADSLTMIGGEVITDPTSAESSALPAKYEWVLIEGAMAKLSPRIQVDVVTHRALFEKGMSLIKRDANSTPGAGYVMASHRPNIIRSTVSGAQFPTNFDILP